MCPGYGVYSDALGCTLSTLVAAGRTGFLVRHCHWSAVIVTAFGASQATYLTAVVSQ